MLFEILHKLERGFEYGKTLFFLFLALVDAIVLDHPFLEDLRNVHRILLIVGCGHLRNCRGSDHHYDEQKRNEEVSSMKTHCLILLIDHDQENKRDGGSSLTLFLEN
ncbi:hypothetical protein RchiOBHm_Chr1g0336621 [Rosa chinensis]|uniref:Uncharacterized protein n=1 Tax=Rosa chinensis TaxID=74649 RepID=A0A2P6SCQ7_ROSCH|nr:hypothetical protein RchiOBHm_Chr1g0336621 [Rosa chinensis]